MPIYLSSKKKGLLETEKRSSVYAFVCPKCGQIKLIAQDPSIWFALMIGTFDKCKKSKYYLYIFSKI